jgi:hypothetical protein
MISDRELRRLFRGHRDVVLWADAALWRDAARELRYRRARAVRVVIVARALVEFERMQPGGSKWLH